MAKLVCPFCGAYTSFTPAMIPWPDTEQYVQAVIKNMYPDPDYAIIVCQACDRHFVAKGNGEWIAVYPIMHKPVSEDIPPPMRGEFEEANLCYAVGAYRACVSMCQITAEHVWNEQQVSGLSELKEKGIISPRLYDRANEIRLWGNLEKHKLIIDPISQGDAKQILDYLEILLDEVYVEPKQLDILTEKHEDLKKSG